MPYKLINILNTNNLFKLKVAGLQILLSLFLISISCTQDPKLWKVTSQQQVITDFLACNPHKYSEFNNLLVSIKLTDLLKVRGPYTLFLPSNEAMANYYMEKGISSYAELTQQEQKDLAYNHLIVNDEIKSGDILLGALRDTNALGDFLVTEFSGSDIIINKHAKITDRDIQCANGYVHQIDQVIEPVKENIYDLIAANPSYSLFAQGLKVTGLSDTLQTVTFRYGKKNARTRFTILAVPDTIFNRFGIHTIDELISYFTNSPDSITYLQNGFYRYMEYHCMANT
ncbi:MAG: fasciclin domain-containing protein, partial [Bacteroidia bacterium]